MLLLENKNTNINVCFLNKFKNFQKRVKKFYFNSNIKSMKIDSYANSFNFSKDLNKSTFKDNDSRDKINIIFFLIVIVIYVYINIKYIFLIEKIFK